MASGILTSQFSTEGDLGAGLIRYLTDGDYSHVDLKVSREDVIAFAKYVPDPALKVQLSVWPYPYGLLGARLIGGVQIRKPDYAKFTKATICSCTVPDITAGYAFGFAQVGKGYDSGALVDMFLHRVRNFSPDMPKWFCDCLNYAIAMEAGRLLLNTVNPERLTPQEEYYSPYWTQKMAVALPHGK